MSVDFLGHFHPLLIHLPIGILLFGVLMEYGFPRRNSDALMQIILLFGTITTVLSAILGWILSTSGDYDAALLDKHKWSGIGLSVLTISLWAWKQKGRKFEKYYLISHLLFGLMLIALLLCGHFGGSLTHGEDFLSLSKISKEEEKIPTLNSMPVTDTTKGTVYDKLITPILSTKCYNCHNASKKKGNLRMQTYDALLKGGKTGPGFKPNDPEHSELIKRILLDIHDDKRMPPRGKKQLTNDEIRLLYWWIQNGASVGTNITEVKKNDTIQAFLSGTKKKAEPSLNLPSIQKVDSLFLIKLQKTQWEVHTISKGSPYVDVSAIGFTSLSNDQLNSISTIAQNIAWLNLANTKINDQSMQVISLCSNLQKLNLSQTAISNASIGAFKKLSMLNHLNLIGTKIDDSGLKQLCEMPNLKRIYCWNSLVTKQGVEECRKKYPQIEIANGENITIKP